MTIEQEAEIARLKTELDFIKQIEFPRRVQLVKDAWSEKVDRLTEERDYYKVAQIDWDKAREHPDY